MKCCFETIYLDCSSSLCGLTSAKDKPSHMVLLVLLDKLCSSEE